jgi:hypothetical protein
MTEFAALPTIWTLVNTHERRRNLRRGYTIGYTTSLPCFVIAVSPRSSANPECRVLEHQPVGSSPSPGRRTAPSIPFAAEVTHVVHPRGSRLSRSLAEPRLCMVMHVGNTGGSRAAGPAGPPGQIGNRPTPANGCPQRIPVRPDRDRLPGRLPLIGSFSEVACHPLPAKSSSEADLAWAATANRSTTASSTLEFCDPINES